jgi:general secretion pathway protein K
MHRSSSLRRKKRGSIVAAVLALIVLLSFLVVAFLDDVKDRLRYSAQFQYQDDLRVEAYSALETTLAVLNIFHEVDGSLWAQQQGWGDPLGWADYTPGSGVQVQVRFKDETGKFSLNSTEYATYRLVFQELDLPMAVGDEVADAILDWIDEDDLPRLNGFDGDDYRDLDPVGYEPANEPIRGWDELELIPPFREVFFDEDGVPLPIYREFRSAFSLTHSGPVNINSAPPLVQRVLERQGLISLDNLNRFKDGPDGEPNTGDERPIRDLNSGGIRPSGSEEGGGITNEIDQLEVEIRVTRGEAFFLLRTLVSWRGANPSAGDTEPIARETTEGARGDDDRNSARAARGNARTQASAGAQLGYPFQLIWIAENRQN